MTAPRSSLATTLADVRAIPVPRFAADSGELWVMEGPATIPIPIVRVFSIRASKGSRRGAHAHIRCTQVFVCLHGRCEVAVDDGEGRELWMLSHENAKALLVPPTLWAEQYYHFQDTVLVTLCDRPYEPEDYIRDYEVFRTWRRGSAKIEGEQLST